MFNVGQSYSNVIRHLMNSKSKCYYL